MTDLLAGLDDAGRRFVVALAGEVGDQPGELLQRLIAHGGPVPTRIEGGRLVALSLTALQGELSRVPALEGLSALAALDVSGLGLTALDVDGAEALEVLRCSDNALTHLEPGQAPRLRELDCSGNRLMLLDLRLNASLEVLGCAGNQISAFLFPERPALRALDCSRNELLVLDLGAQPALEELSCSRNPMLGLQLGHAPRLRVLECARCELSELSLQGAPALESLDCARNRLGGLDLSGCPALRQLDCVGNYVEHLDLQGRRALVTVRCRGNQLRELVLGAHPSLEELDCADNRLRALQLAGCPALLVLRCAGNELTSLHLGGNPALCAVDARSNALAALDVSAARGLARLSVSDNDLRELDLRSNPELFGIDLDPQVEVLASPGQRHRLAALRDREGLGTGSTDPASMDSWELHEFSASYRGHDAESRLLQVVRSPRCDLGTALMIYWMSAPHYYLRYASRQEVEDFEQPGWDLLAEIEQRVEAGFYDRREIWFDPRNDKQTRSVRGYDWTREVREPRWPVHRLIPARMLAPSKPQP